MRRSAVGPADQFGVLVVALGVAPNLAREVGQRGKSPAWQQVPHDFGETKDFLWADAYYLALPGRREGITGLGQANARPQRAKSGVNRIGSKVGLDPSRDQRVRSLVVGALENVRP